MLRMLGWWRKVFLAWLAWRGTCCSLVRFCRWMRLRPRWRRSMRALPRWTLPTWVTLARAPACAAAPRLALVGMELQAAGAEAGSATLLLRRGTGGLDCELTQAK